jgi:hypothetical protein
MFGQMKKFYRSRMLKILFLSTLIPLLSCYEQTVEVSTPNNVVTEILVCRESCSAEDADSVLALRYENGVAIISVDTIGIGECVELPLSSLSEKEFTRSDSITFGFVKDAREWWGPPRERQLTLVTMSLEMDSVVIGCR